MGRTPRTPFCGNKFYNISSLVKVGPFLGSGLYVLGWPKHHHHHHHHNVARMGTHILVPHTRSATQVPTSLVSFEWKHNCLKCLGWSRHVKSQARPRHRPRVLPLKVYWHLYIQCFAMQYSIGDILVQWDALFCSTQGDQRCSTRACACIFNRLFSLL